MNHMEDWSTSDLIAEIARIAMGDHPEELAVSKAAKELDRRWASFGTAPIPMDATLPKTWDSVAAHAEAVSKKPVTVEMAEFARKHDELEKTPILTNADVAREMDNGQLIEILKRVGDTSEEAKVVRKELLKRERARKGIPEPEHEQIEAAEERLRTAERKFVESTDDRARHPESKLAETISRDWALERDRARTALWNLTGRSVIPAEERLRDDVARLERDAWKKRDVPERGEITLEEGGMCNLREATVEDYKKLLKARADAITSGVRMDFLSWWVNHGQEESSPWVPARTQTEREHQAELRKIAWEAWNAAEPETPSERFERESLERKGLAPHVRINLMLNGLAGAAGENKQLLLHWLDHAKKSVELEIKCVNTNIEKGA